MRTGYLTGVVLGILWAFTISVSVSILMSFATGFGFKPAIIGVLLIGIISGLAILLVTDKRVVLAISVVTSYACIVSGIGPIVLADDASAFHSVLTAMLTGAAIWAGMRAILKDLAFGQLERYEFEVSIIRFLTGFGYIFFTAIVLIPFYVMVVTSLKSQQALMQNPLDFSVDLSQGWNLFRSYQELFRDFNFGSYLWTSFYISVLTVLITLLFSVPGAYAVARLRFPGQKAFARSILLIAGVFSWTSGRGGGGRANGRTVAP